LPGCRCPEVLLNEELEVCSVVHQPVEVEQALVDHVLVAGALVFEDEGAAVLVDAEGVHSPAVLLEGAQ